MIVKTITKIRDKAAKQQMQHNIKQNLEGENKTNKIIKMKIERE